MTENNYCIIFYDLCIDCDLCFSYGGRKNPMLRSCIRTLNDMEMDKDWYEWSDSVSLIATDMIL